MDNFNDNGHIVILGCGDVGRWVVETLKHAGIRFAVVDNIASNFENVDYDHVIGNATEEEVLISAGVTYASTIVVALNDDTDIMFATLIARGLNPNSTIIARVNSYKSIDKVYRAGANYVAALPIVAGQMLAKMTSQCFDHSCKKMDEDIMLYEGIDIEKHTVTGEDQLVGRKIADIDMRNKIGCTIIGIEREGTVITDILPSTIIMKGDIIAVVGGKKEIIKFKEKYVR
ncbi:potassium channel family protein [Methanolobus psychrotolerans]|uniref:potassium channel family protein n=1 Tax=Methanolobus psychrotolerans TaxID=1874706 RepID=UPI000B91A1E5|nr:NAD-binding protein [Methanolobus psychrotolerans]